MLAGLQKKRNAQNPLINMDTKFHVLQKLGVLFNDEIAKELNAIADLISEMELA
jgi:hypothetical protein